MIDGQDKKGRSVFIEAKVKTFQVCDWHIADEFDLFRKGFDQKKLSKKVFLNLFVQLFYKVRLVRGLRQGGIPALQKGIPFPTWSSKGGFARSVEMGLYWRPPSTFRPISMRYST